MKYLLVALLLSSPAMAQQTCAKRADIVGHLAKQYSEAPVAIGLASNGGVIEVLSKPGGTFTMIITRPDGVSCLVAAGENWETVPIVETMGPES